MTIIVVDAYAWIEYFDGTTIGEKVKRVIEDANNVIFTNVITLAELASIFTRKNKNYEEAKKIILSRSSFYEVNMNFTEEVGKLHAELKKNRKHISLADVFVLLTAKKLGGKVITGDKDFKGLKEVIML